MWDFLRDSETSESEDDEFGPLIFSPCFFFFPRDLHPTFCFVNFGFSKNHRTSAKEPYEKWDILHINWCRISSINSMFGEFGENSYPRRRLKS